ncbi:MAG TPA: septal ring lytic transglycosylase RlpA family protein [Chitinophagaceae bacterium]|jgi:rare lipoprotein A|nr:septal ring lytic transglycosylase RlpA family protein [Chitinophagaceae bacterium]
MRPYSILFFILIISSLGRAEGQQGTVAKKKKATPKILYGTASYYADKFNGRRTANGEIFSQKKMTAACNVLPLGTWIKVTNLRNGKWVIVKTNDRLHSRMKRVVDLSTTAARQLGYYKAGLAKVKVEVLGKKKPVLKSSGGKQ